MRKLTDKQATFCKEYLIDLNATQAAIRAGYSNKTAGSVGHENLTKPEIQAEIGRLQQERAKRIEISSDDVLRDIISIKDDCMQKIPMTTKTGEVIGEHMLDTNGALKANELLGKHLKLFTDKVEHSGEVKIPEIIIKRGEPCQKK